MLKHDLRDHLRPQAHRFALEARQLFDGAALATTMADDAGEHADAHAAQQSSEAAHARADSAPPPVELADTPAAPAPASHEVYVVDQGVSHWQDLVASLPPGSDVILLAADRSGTEQLAQALAGRGDIDVLHILGHGSANQFELGNQHLDADSLDRAQADWRAIGAALSANGDILLYGCEVAADGTQLIDRLAQLTGADIAASTDATGGALAGGNWTLEARSGAIEARSLEARDYEGLLAAPTLTNTGAATVSIGENTPTVVGAGLTVSGTGTDVLVVTARVTSGAGQLSFDAGTPGGVTLDSGSGSFQMVFRGTAAAVQQGIQALRYTYVGASETGAADSLSLSVLNNTAGGTAALTRAITIVAQNDVPTVTPPAFPNGAGLLTVDEGGTVSFTAPTNAGLGTSQAQLGLIDADSLALPTIVTVTALPALGTLQLNGTAIAAGATLSLADIANLRYVHNGAQVLSATQDTFTISVNDGAGGVVSGRVVNVKIMPVNQAPTVGGTVTLVEGEQGVGFGNSALPAPLSGARGGVAIVDPDQAAGVSHSVMILSLPAHGTLRYNGVALLTPQTIANIALLSYDHDGSETTADSFTLRVIDDGGGTGTSASADATIQLTIIPNNDDPVLVHNTGLVFGDGSAAPGNTVTITAAMLGVSDADSANALLTYTLRGVPDRLTQGHLVSVDQPGKALPVNFTFTQADLDAGKISFVATTTTAFVGGFDFTVRDGAYRLLPLPAREGGIYDDVTTTTLKMLHFAIDYRGSPIAVTPGDPSLVPNAAPVIDGTLLMGPADIWEGATVALTPAQLTATDPDNTPEELTFRLTVLPSRGSLLVDGVALNLYGSFTMAELIAGKVAFRHDGGELFQATFSLTMSDGNQTTATSVFTVNVRPQNDTPVARPGVTVRANEGGSTTLDGTHLQLSDADNDTPTDATTGFATDNALSFTITGNVAHGSLALDGVTITVGGVVTAAQLAAGKLVYRHDGSETTSDSFKLTPLDDRGVTGADPANLGNQSSTGAEITIAVAITATNDAPTFVGKWQPIAAEAGAMLEGATLIIRGATSYTGGLGGLAGSGTPVSSTGPRLVFADSDNASAQRSYRLTIVPTRGTLRLSGTTLTVGSTFTQADLDAGRVTYVHGGAEVTAAAGETDFFDYVVTDGDYSSNDQTTDNASASPSGTSPAASRYNLEIVGANDKPTVTAAATTLVLNSSITAIALPVITLADLDVTALRPDEVNFLQVSVAFTDSAGVAYANGVLAFNAATPAGVVVITNTPQLLVFQGTLANVRTALNLVRARTAGIDADRSDLRIRVTVDDRLRDASGALTAGANGGASNAGGLTINDTNNTSSVDIAVSASDRNDMPVVSNATPTQTVNEDVLAQVLGLSFTDVDAFASTNVFTLQITTVNGQAFFSAAGAVTYAGATIVSGSTAARNITLSGTRATLNGLLGSLYFRSNPNYNGDGSLSITVNDSGNTGIDGTEDAGLRSATVTLAINPVNDVPVLTMPLASQRLDNGSFAFTGANAISVTDPSDLVNTATPLGFEVGRENDFTVTLNAQRFTADYGAISVDTSSGGAVIITGNNTATLTLKGDRAAINTWLATATYTVPAGDVDRNQTIVFTVTIDDGDNGGTALTSGVTGPRTANGNFRLISSTVNDAPGFAGLDATPTYLQGSPTPIVLDANATLTDPELVAYGLWTGATLSIQRDGGANANDVFGTTGSGATGINFSGSDVRFDAGVIGTFTQAAGVLTITFTNANNTRAYQILQGITYINTDAAPAGTVTLRYTLNDQNPTGGPATGGLDQGTGGQRETSALLVVTINRTTGAVSDVNSVDEGASTASASTASGNVVTGTAGAGIDLDIDGDTLIVQGVRTGTATSVATVGTANVGVNLVGSYGTLRMQADGTYVYTLDNTRTATQAMTAASTPLSEVFSYAIKDRATGLASTSYATLTISIVGTNDAPVLADTVLTMPTVAETGAAPSGAMGSLVSSFTGGITDVDTGALKGIAIVGQDTSLGSWYYSIDNGTTWASIAGATGPTHSLLLAPDARMYFRAAQSMHGNVASGLLIRAWDQSAGVSGDVADTSVPGGLSAFSAATDSVALSVRSINEAPVIGGLGPVAIGEYLRAGTATVIDASITVADAELDVSPTGWQGATLSLQRVGGAHVDDEFEGSGVLRFDAGRVWLAGVDVGSVTQVAGALSIGFGSAASTSVVQGVLQAIAYRNSNASAPATVELGFVLNDQNSSIVGGGVAGTGQAQGEGGRLLTNGSITLNLTSPRLPPQLSLPDGGLVPSVAERGLGNAADTGETLSGSFVLATGGVFEALTVDTDYLSAAALRAATPARPISVQTARGTLSVNGFDPLTGVVQYQYTLRGPQDHRAGPITERIALSVLETDGHRANATLVVQILDDAPSAGDVSASLGRTDSGVAGNLLGASRIGADVTATPVSALHYGGQTVSVGVPFSTAYGSLVVNADGSYRYALDSSNPAVAALARGQSLHEQVNFTITDADGSSRSASLGISIEGSEIVVPPRPVTPPTSVTPVPPVVVLPTAPLVPVAVPEAVPEIILPPPPAPLPVTITVTDDRLPPPSPLMPTQIRASQLSAPIFGDRVDPVRQPATPFELLRDPTRSAPQADLVQTAVRDAAVAYQRSLGMLASGRGQAENDESLSTLLNIAPSQPDTEYVARDGVAFSRGLLRDSPGARMIDSSLAIGADSLFDDFAPFRPVDGRLVPADADASEDRTGGKQEGVAAEMAAGSRIDSRPERIGLLAMADLSPAPIDLPPPRPAAPGFSAQLADVARARALIREGHAPTPTRPAGSS
jgi:VCBS repeat-containing protein